MLRTWVFRLGCMASLAAWAALGLAACSGEGGCGGDKKSKTVKCGEGTKQVEDGDGYKCVPNTN